MQSEAKNRILGEASAGLAKLDDCHKRDAQGASHRVGFAGDDKEFGRLASGP
jgi:hypothetical protein